MLQFLLLASAWLMWSGHYTLDSPLIAAFGLLSCLAVTLLSRRMRVKAPHGRDRTLTWRTLFYLPWLVKQIVMSNLTVARLILDPKQRISPRIVRVEATQRGEGALVLFANSITLTPGTISLSVKRGAIVVHALSRPIADDLLGGEMNRRVSALEREV
jgi:multicomponent Na+:H+ antiporter subunit E